MAEHSDNESKTSRFYRSLSNYYLDYANNDTAQIYLDKALNLAEEVEYKIVEGCMYLSLDNLSNRQNKYVLGIGYYIKALSLWNRKNS
ncbi:MAG: hypothetical protein GX963_05190 [Bacteroidales bacterium]|nr:hypothetical protein [Bacteroidales bacterium]